MDVNQKLLDFILDCGVFYYATVDEGKARVRPFGFATILDGKLYFGMGDHKRSYRETVANPYVEICACKLRFCAFNRLFAKFLPLSVVPCKFVGERSQKEIVCFEEQSHDFHCRVEPACGVHSRREAEHNVLR